MTVDSRSPITNYQLPTTNYHYQLPITNYQLPITNSWNLQIFRCAIEIFPMLCYLTI
ncbi:MAG: hypothetical protein HC786_10740 [Richelia sp. CSU_2_1]|nr:hypothetical protein [Microcoleus sp. SU_5_6]NJR22595.1 hypothetical protein [Richelia sp. CSU_2_1]